MYQFEPVKTPPGDMRNAYLDGLSEHQECFLEQLVHEATAWCVPDRAYVMVHGSQIVEFFVAPACINDAAAVFDAARIATSAKIALCKSFDAQMLGPALARPARVTATGILFRSFSNIPFEQDSDLGFRMAGLNDTAAVAACNDDGFFEGRDEIERRVEAGTLHLLERQGELVGCGTQTRVNSGRPAVDLGMLVARPERGRGYGSRIIAHMKTRVLEQGLAPVCGCAARNHASHHALVKAGFHGDHRLLKIEFETG
ncbi:MAG: GNAT family N-acetyltransferase [Alphaproteobacteria bacterium]|nr:GNAT family N-acetyltransferase [Alphaproteobacteria bacterium]